MTADHDLCYLSATELLRLFKDKDLSPVEFTSACLDRMADAEPYVNAFVETHSERAMDEARAAEGRYLRPDTSPPRLLEGLAVAVKADLAIEGDKASLGCWALKDVRSDHTDVFPARIQQQGGIIHGRTSMPEFAGASFTHTRLWGVTRNPWNQKYSPGGSSGGSAASLACGSSVLATGSDNAGSIRMPASYCGVVGYKPPHGRVPASAPLNLDSYFSLGPLARTVEDAALFLSAVAGPDLSDRDSLPALACPRADVAKAQQLRVAVSEDLGGFCVEEEIRQVMRGLIARLEPFAAQVELASPQWETSRVLTVGEAHLQYTVGQMAARALSAFPDDLMPYTQAFARASAAAPAPNLLDLLEGHQYVWDALRVLFARYDVLVCPAQGLFGFEAGEDYADRQPLINGRPVKYPFETHMGLPFNSANTCPVLTVPVAISSVGVPVGVQVVGRPFAEQDVFALGAAIEAMMDRKPFASGHRPILTDRSSSVPDGAGSGHTSA